MVFLDLLNIFPQQFSASLERYIAQSVDARQSRTLWIGFSGGLDSTVLAHLACHAKLPPAITVKLCHVHHGLQSAAEDWAGHVQQQAAAWGVGCEILKVKVDPVGTGIEAAARQARYAAWESLLEPGDLLLLGHHADDQTETVLLRWCRGAGSVGLAGIPMQRPLSNQHTAIVLRPLLTFSKAELKHYAEAHGLSWIEDPSNVDDQFDRNFMRQRVLPVLQQRWPSLQQTVNRNSALQAEAAILQADLAVVDVGGDVTTLQQSFLAINPWCVLPSHRQRNVLYHWLREQTSLPMPGQRHIQELLKAIASDRYDAETQVGWSGGEVRYWRGKLYVVTALSHVSAPPTISWSNPCERLLLPPGLGTLQATGIVEPLTIRWRQGGEKIRYRGQTKKLKTLWQEFNVLPWMRDRVPLLYRNDELIAVGDLCVADRYQHQSDGLQVSWSRSCVVTEPE